MHKTCCRIIFLPQSLMNLIPPPLLFPVSFFLCAWLIANSFDSFKIAVWGKKRRRKREKGRGDWREAKNIIFPIMLTAFTGAI